VIPDESYSPFRFRQLDNKTIITNEVGDFDFYDNTIVERFFSGNLTKIDYEKLEKQSIKINKDEAWKYLSLIRSIKNKKKRNEKLDYLIVVPTLRCNLSCSYCQVSRANESAKGYDWDEDTLVQFEEFIKVNGKNGMKIEFQGGEPTLRLDLVKKIISISENYYSDLTFVICTNLSKITKDLRNILSKDNVLISTSIDGPDYIMSSNRTFDDKTAKETLENIKEIIKEYGHNKISALPTITNEQRESPDVLIDYYRELGFNSIFLRPVNFHGFARKNFSDLSRQIDSWNSFYTKAMEYILKINQTEYFEEFYTGIVLRQIFSGKESGFVDYKSPANYSKGYCVVDFDGKIYPTDESRMLSRTKNVDLCIGNLKEGLNTEKVNELNFNAIHHVNEDCIHCAYMPFCGIDIIDDMSRYNRFDRPKDFTWFCKRHMYLYDFIFKKIIDWDTDWLYMFNSWVQRSQNNHRPFEIFQ
jgi:His-Xaa-Ser system radical SAM maturase HxsB